MLGQVPADTDINVVLSGVRMPRMNSITERWIQARRHELLDRTLIANRAHLLNALRAYEHHHNRHRPHHGIVFYTDGVTEARDATGEMFGIDRLVEQAQRHAAEELPAPETLRRLARAVANFYDGPARDDTTLLLADWSPSASRRSIP